MRGIAKFPPAPPGGEMGTVDMSDEQYADIRLQVLQLREQKVPFVGHVHFSYAPFGLICTVRLPRNLIAPLDLGHHVPVIVPGWNRFTNSMGHMVLHADLRGMHVPNSDHPSAPLLTLE